MCTWAYAWFASRPDTTEYMPILFIAGMIADATIVGAIAQAFSSVCR